MTLVRLSVFATAVLLSAGGASAQTSRDDPTDLQSWIEAGVTLDLPDRWEVDLDYQLRMVGDAGTYRGSYLTAEVTRGVLDHLDLFASYRLSLLDDGTFHRGAAGAEIKGDVGGATLSFRPMLQVQRAAAPDDDENASGDKVMARGRLRAKLDLPGSFEVYVATEPYIRFGADYPIDNWRNTLGVQWSPGRGPAMDLFYIYRPDYAKSYNRTFHVIGIKLGFGLKAG